MEKVTTICSIAMPLPMTDVDTDLIIPAQYLTSVSRKGYGENLFRRLRDNDANFVLNQPKYSGAEILLTDSNFGCGSSREHAVWAILGAGIRVVIGKSFADIFSSNSAKNGLLLVVLPETVVDALFKEAESGVCKITVDLSTQTVTLPNGTVQQFAFDPFRKHCLLNGLEDLDYILSSKAEIEAFRKKQTATRFFSTRTPNN